MLQDGPYPLPLKQRVLSSKGHLANGDSVDLAARLAEDRLQLLVLAHLSEINNHPDLVLQEVRRRLTSFGTLEVLLASQWQAGPLIEILP